MVAMAGIVAEAIPARATMARIIVAIPPIASTNTESLKL
jgi:hypothetical protein